MKIKEKCIFSIIHPIWSGVRDQFESDKFFRENAGIDYLSVAAFDDLIPSHLVFLENRVRQTSMSWDSFMFNFKLKFSINRGFMIASDLWAVTVRWYLTFGPTLQLTLVWASSTLITCNAVVLIYSVNENYVIKYLNILFWVLILVKCFYLPVKYI